MYKKNKEWKWREPKTIRLVAQKLLFGSIKSHNQSIQCFLVAKDIVIICETKCH